MSFKSAFPLLVTEQADPKIEIYDGLQKFFLTLYDTMCPRT